MGRAPHGTDEGPVARILLVVDDPSVRALTAEALVARGHVVTEDSPDAVVLDSGTPDALAQLARYAPLPVVAVVPWSEPDTIRLFVDRGARGYVTMPFAPEAVADAVSAALAGGEGERLQTVLAQQAVAARRTGRPFSVVLADVDRFTTTVAETDADDMLRAVAKRFRLHAGVSDVLIHWHGNCYAIVLPGTDAERAAARAGQLRAALAGSPVDAGTAVAPLTASFGVAEFAPSEQGEELIDRALDALHEAEAGGGDAVRTAEPAAAALP
jgi:diguanylate cyclase (GGDEF)-like protein